VNVSFRHVSDGQAVLGGEVKIDLDVASWVNDQCFALALTAHKVAGLS
jgi:hypothetical protein